VDQVGPYRTQALTATEPTALAKRPMNPTHKRWIVEGAAYTVLGSILAVVGGEAAIGALLGMIGLTVFMEVGIFFGERSTTQPTFGELPFHVVFGDRRSTLEPIATEIERVQVTFARPLNEAERAAALAGVTSRGLTVADVPGATPEGPTVLLLTGWSHIFTNHGKLIELLVSWGGALHARIGITEVQVWMRDRPSVGVA